MTSEEFYDWMEERDMLHPFLAANGRGFDPAQYIELCVKDKLSRNESPILCNSWYRISARWRQLDRELQKFLDRDK